MLTDCKTRAPTGAINWRVGFAPSSWKTHYSQSAADSIKKDCHEYINTGGKCVFFSLSFFSTVAVNEEMTFLCRFALLEKLSDRSLLFSICSVSSAQSCYGTRGTLAAKTQATTWLKILQWTANNKTQSILLSTLKSNFRPQPHRWETLWAFTYLI